MKKGILAMLVLLIGAPTVADASSYVAPQCTECQLATPIPDTTTATALDQYGVSTTFYQAPVTYLPGDTVTICDTTACVTYTRTTDHQYLGGALTPINSNPGGGNQCH